MVRSLLLSSLLALEVAAHGYIQTVTLDGVAHEGFYRWNNKPDPKAIGWSFTTEDEGPVLDISNPDMACRKGSAPAKNYGKVAAGGKADFFWTSADKVINPNGWAESHRGPIITYIAPCNGDCTTASGGALKWTKIHEEGLISGTANTKGVWAADKLRQNGGINSVTIPKSIAPGKYVIRNEIIALHRAHINEPEFYGQCANIEVTGSGTDDLSGKGVIATQLYKKSDNIFGFDVYNVGKETSWPIPGPALYSGASAGNTDGGNTDNGNGSSPVTTTPGNTTPGNTTPGNTTPGNTTPGNTTPGNTDGDKDTDDKDTDNTPTPNPGTGRWPNRPGRPGKGGKGKGKNCE